MYHELNIYDNKLSESQAQDYFFQAIDLQLNGICCPIYYVPLLHANLPEGMTLSAPIDFPNGMSDPRVKNHAIVNAVRKGVNAIDLVVNPNHVENGRYKDIAANLSGHYDICKDKNVTLRLMLDYRAYIPAMKLLDVVSIATQIGIEYVFPSTGHLIDNYADNILASRAINAKYPNVNVISNGNLWKEDQYQAVLKANLFGVRFNSIHAVKNCMAGV